MLGAVAADDEGVSVDIPHATEVGGHLEIEVSPHEEGVGFGFCGSCVRRRGGGR